MDEQNSTQKKEERAVSRTGIDYAIQLAYTAVDKSERDDKRDLLYSLVCFGCMFDDCYAADPDPIVKKYDCLNAPEPNKVDLYVLTRTIITLNGATEELRTMWYLMFAYVLLSEAPHEQTIYDEIATVLQTPDTYEKVLRSRYSVFIPPTEEELVAQGASLLLTAWYAPYLRYCAERDEHGITRETAECKRLLALGQFDDALLRSERLLAAFPDDLQIAITNIAARVSLSSASDPAERTALLKDTLSLIDEYIGMAQNQYFRYYRGLTLLGLMDTVGAREEFTRCVQNDPSFELAAFMLKGMDTYEN
ncbi:MAG: hypothetical protein HFE47_06025 [Clostridia bacterium]|nr:hypothetical protein [Clostridia bacterium]